VSCGEGEKMNMCQFACMMMLPHKSYFVPASSVLAASLFWWPFAPICSLKHSVASQSDRYGCKRVYYIPPYRDPLVRGGAEIHMAFCLELFEVSDQQHAHR
jgi:hypothetical protein